MLMLPNAELPQIDLKIWDQWRSWSDRYATSFFQSAEWAETLVRHYSFYHPEPVFSDDFFLPLFRHKRWSWFSDSLYGMPLMTYAGVLSPTPGSPLIWEEIESDLEKKSVGTIVLSFPPGHIHCSMDSFRQSEGETHMLDLTPGYETLFEHFVPNCQNKVRKAERDGVEISIENNEEGASTHWALVTPFLEKWAPNPPITPQLLTDLILLPQSRLYIARLKGRPVVSQLAFAYHGEIFLWQLARTHVGFPAGAGNLLIARLIQDSIDEGIQILNLGASVGDRGVERFKCSFGATKCGYPILKRVHPLVRWLK